MASTKEYLEYVTEQLSLLDEITYKSMMGEYLIYYRGKLIGGIYDDRFLVKPNSSALEIVKEPKMEIPYQGAKAMLSVENVDDRDFLKELVTALYKDLPGPKKRK